MDLSGGIDGWELAGHGGLERRQLLGDLLGAPRSLLDNLLNPKRPTTTEEQTPPPATSTPRAEQPPPASPTTTTPEPQKQPTTPPARSSPTPEPENTPPPPPPPAPSPSSTLAPAPSPSPRPPTTSQTPESAPTPVPRFSSVVPSQSSAIVSRPTPEEAHQSLPLLNPLPTQEADVLPIGSSSLGFASSSTRQNLVPTAGPGEPQNKGAVSGEGNSGMEFTQRLALGLGLALFAIVVLVSAFVVCQWRRRRRQKRGYNNGGGVTPYAIDTKVALGPPPPIPDPEIGIRHIHEHHHFHNMDERPTLPDLGEYDRQASTAAWAQKLPPPPSPRPPSETEKEAETGIIRIFRWPTMSSRSDLTALTRPWGASSNAQKFSKTSSWTSRASRSTLSTMLWRSRRSIARRRGEDGNGQSVNAPEEESSILQDAQPAPQVERQPIPARKPVQKQPEVRREKSRRQQRKRRESALTVSSAGGGSIASSSVLSPTLMAFPVPPKSVSSLSMVLAGHVEPLPPLPATVYQPYRP